MRHLIKGYWPTNPSRIFLEEETQRFDFQLKFIFFLVIKAYIYKINKNTITKTLSIVEKSLKLHPHPNTHINLFSLDMTPLHYMVRTGNYKHWLLATLKGLSKGSVPQERREIQIVS